MTLDSKKPPIIPPSSATPGTASLSIPEVKEPHFPVILESTDPIVHAFHKKAGQLFQEKVKDKKIIGIGSYSKVIGLDKNLAFVVPKVPRSRHGRATLPPFNLADYQKVKKAMICSPFLLAAPLGLDERLRRLVPRGEMDLLDWLYPDNDSTRRNPVLTNREVALIALQILLGLKVLHERNWAHLDLKAKNIIIMDEASRHVMIIDISIVPINKDGCVNKDCRFPTSKEIIPTEAQNLPKVTGSSARKIISDETSSTASEITIAEDKKLLLTPGHIINFDFMRKYPKQMDIHAYGLLLKELSSFSKDKSPPELSRIIEKTTFKTAGQISIEEILASPYWDIALNKYLSDGASREEAISKLVKFYDQMLSKKTQGFFYNTDYGLNSPLQSAPLEIREVVLKYETLKNKESYFVDGRYHSFNQVGLILKKIRMRSEELSDTQKVMRNNPQYKKELSDLSNSLLYKPGMYQFIDDFFQHYEEFIKIEDLYRKNKFNSEDDYLKFIEDSNSLKESIKECYKEGIEKGSVNELNRKCLSILDYMKNQIDRMTEDSLTTKIEKYIASPYEVKESSSEETTNISALKCKNLVQDLKEVEKNRIIGKITLIHEIGIINNLFERYIKQLDDEGVDHDSKHRLVAGSHWFHEKYGHCVDSIQFFNKTMRRYVDRDRDLKYSHINQAKERLLKNNILQEDCDKYVKIVQDDFRILHDAVEKYVKEKNLDAIVELEVDTDFKRRIELLGFTIENYLDRYRKSIRPSDLLNFPSSLSSTNLNLISPFGSYPQKGSDSTTMKKDDKNSASPSPLDSYLISPFGFYPPRRAHGVAVTQDETHPDKSPKQG